jgi:Tfp pilus assembly protein PilV
MPMYPIKPTWRSFKLIFVVCVGLFGALLLILGLYSSIMDTSASSWPVTEGTITSSQVESWGSGAHDPIDYRPAITYQYQVGGKTYNGSQISSGATFYGGVNVDEYEQANAIVSNYPVGSIVEVHYNPNNPNNAVLETQSSLIEQVPLIIGAVMTAAALIGLFLLVRSERKS